MTESDFYGEVLHRTNPKYGRKSYEQILRSKILFLAESGYNKFETVSCFKLKEAKLIQEIFIAEGFDVTLINHYPHENLEGNFYRLYFTWD